MQLNKFLLFIVSLLFVTNITIAARMPSPDPDMTEALRQSLEGHRKDSAARAQEDEDLAAAMTASRLDARSPVGSGAGGAARRRSTSPHRGAAGTLDFSKLTTGEVFHLTRRQHPTLGVKFDSLAIRRSLQDYEREHETHKLVLGAGHKKRRTSPHDQTLGRFPDYYAVDLLIDGECYPDAVLDITNKSMMAYFPSNWADEVYVDEGRIFIGEQFGMLGPRGIGVGRINEESIGNVIRILKPGKKWILPTRGNGPEALEGLKKLGASEVIIDIRATLEEPGKVKEVFVITK